MGRRASRDVPKVVQKKGVPQSTGSQAKGIRGSSKRVRAKAMASVIITATTLGKLDLKFLMPLPSRVYNLQCSVPEFKEDLEINLRLSVLKKTGYARADFVYLSPRKVDYGKC